MANIKLEQFEGPLDLLLRLIENQELSITEIALAQVTEQFLHYVRELEVRDPSHIADYLIVATKLLVIKSRAILPFLSLPDDPEMETAAEDLTAQLQSYQELKSWVGLLKPFNVSGKQSFSRVAVFLRKVHFIPDETLTPETLLGKAGGLISALKALEKLPQARVRQAVSIQEKIMQLQDRLGRAAQTRLSELIRDSQDKHEVIVTFLALLELTKQRVVIVAQSEAFGDIDIRNFETQIV